MRRVSQELVYKLLYPGVVGSMFFDLFDPLRFVENQRFHPFHPIDFPLLVSRIAIIALFLLDYVHLEFILKPSGLVRGSRHRRLDLSIAAFICFAYFAFGRASVVVKIDRIEHVAFFGTVGLVAMAIAMFFVSFYGVPPAYEEDYEVCRVLPLAIAVLWAPVVYFAEDPWNALAIGNLALLASYAGLVAVFLPVARRVPPEGAAQQGAAADTS